MTEIEDNLIRGFADFRAGRLDEAESRCAASLAANPMNAVALHLRGLIRAQRGDIAEALFLIARSIGIDATPPFFHSNLGFLYLHIGQKEKAIAPFRRALELDPAFDDARTGLSQALSASTADVGSADEDQDDQRRNAQRLTEIDPELSKGFDDYQAGRIDAAERRCTQALVADPQNPAALHLQGLVAAERGDLAGSVQLMCRALALDDTRASFRSNLGFLLLNMGRRDEAITHFQRSLELDPTHVVGYRGLSKALLPGEHYSSILTRFHEAVRPKLYVEIGVADGYSLRLTRPDSRVVAIDPAPKIDHELPPNTSLFTMTSDAFFSAHDLRKIGGQPSFDLAFIDGLHCFDQVLRDFINLERYSRPDSIILIHDCYPIDALSASRQRTTMFWTGDVWKIVPLLRTIRPDLTVFTIASGPSGLGVVTGLDRHSALLDERYDSLVTEYLEMPYSAIEEDRQNLLGVVPTDWGLIWRCCTARSTTPGGKEP